MNLPRDLVLSDCRCSASYEIQNVVNVLVISFCLKGAGVLLFASKSMLVQGLKRRTYIHAKDVLRESTHKVNYMTLQNRENC